MLLEHKLHEPAFYSTVLQDWGSSIPAAQRLGAQAQCLVDLGHHAPNVNIEQIVARLHRFGKPGGFHFNDSKYGDDDLDSGAHAHRRDRGRVRGLLGGQVHLAAPAHVATGLTGAQELPVLITAGRQAREQHQGGQDGECAQRED